jgi:hypothetical protein
MSSVLSAVWPSPWCQMFERWSALGGSAGIGRLHEILDWHEARKKAVNADLSSRPWRMGRVWKAQTTARPPVPLSSHSAPSTIACARRLAAVPLEPLGRAKRRQRPVAMGTCWRASSRPSALSPPDLVAVDEIKEDSGVALRLIFPVISSMHFPCLKSCDCLNKSGKASAACQWRSLPPSGTLKCYVSEPGDSPMAKPSVSPGTKRKPICSGLRNEHPERHGADRHAQRVDLQLSS